MIYSTELAGSPVSRAEGCNRRGGDEGGAERIGSQELVHDIPTTEGREV